MLRKQRTPVAVRLTNNAVLKYRQPNGVVFDPDRGHNVPRESVVDVLASLDRITYTPQDLYAPQVENASIQYMEGESAININPAQRETVKAVISDVPGIFYLEPTIQESSTFRYGFSRLTGYPVRGWFQPGGEI